MDFNIEFDPPPHLPHEETIIPIWLPSTFTCGTLVETKVAHITGMITGVMERFKQYKYEVSYFVGGKQEVIWMDAGEFDVVIDGPRPVGFDRGRTTQ
jgi:hypothetical protein